MSISRRVRPWLLIWLPGALLMALTLVIIPNPSGRWTWTYGSVGRRSPQLTPGLVVGQTVPAPGKPFTRVGLRFYLHGAKTDSLVEVRLLRGGTAPRNLTEVKERTLAKETVQHKALRGDRFYRLHLDQQAGAST